MHSHSPFSFFLQLLLSFIKENPCLQYFMKLSYNNFKTYITTNKITSCGMIDINFSTILNINDIIELKSIIL